MPFLVFGFPGGVVLEVRAHGPPSTTDSRVDPEGSASVKGL